MRILAFTDLHGSKGALKKLRSAVKRKKPDLMVCCGDLSIFEMNLDTLIQKVDKLNVPVLMVHGNHEDQETMSALCEATKNITFIHGRAHAIDSFLFLGYGGDGFSIIDKEFARLAKTFRKELKRHKDKASILITHAPPYGTKLDELLDEQHCGNRSIRSFISRTQPQLALCGHIHENFGREDKIQRTRILNPGPYGKIVRV